MVLKIISSSGYDIISNRVQVVQFDGVLSKAEGIAYREPHGSM